jgi:uncharacterized protein YbaR (Trm112 family)
MALDPGLLEVLACPTCKKAVEPSEDGDWLICRECRVKYEIAEDIPIMLPSEAHPLED